MFNDTTGLRVPHKATLKKSEWWDNGALPLWITAQNQVILILEQIKITKSWNSSGLCYKIISFWTKIHNLSVEVEMAFNSHVKHLFLFWFMWQWKMHSVIIVFLAGTLNVEVLNTCTTSTWEMYLLTPIWH